MQAFYGIPNILDRYLVIDSHELTLLSLKPTHHLLEKKINLHCL